MIIVGYQGIGKSTLAGKNNCIDLESSNFFVDGKRDENWYKIYTNIAIDLSQQGFIVFTSSHKIVREEISKSNEDKYIIVPHHKLKVSWIKKLEDRFNRTKSEKDYKAYINAIECFDDNINDLISESGFKIIMLDNMEYSLSQIIENIK